MTSRALLGDKLRHFKVHHIIYGFREEDGATIYSLLTSSYLVNFSPRSPIIHISFVSKIHSVQDSCLSRLTCFAFFLSDFVFSFSCSSDS